MVGRPVVGTTGLKHLLSLGGVYAQPRATGAMRGPAFMRREVSWPRLAATCCSPTARPSAAASHARVSRALGRGLRSAAVSAQADPLRAPGRSVCASRCFPVAGLRSLRSPAVKGAASRLRFARPCQPPLTAVRRSGCDRDEGPLTQISSKALPTTRSSVFRRFAYPHVAVNATWAVKTQLWLSRLISEASWRTSIPRGRQGTDGLLRETRGMTRGGHCWDP